jgi:mannitol/fructose-specific phosphotransferase system IIA component (Ntr-type)/Kef-type K+ transport system membrane component KefB
MSFETFYMQIVALGLLVLAAHYGGRITRRLHLGEVVGQVMGGLLVGPILLFAIEHRFPGYREALQSLHFLTFVFLSLIAFGIGDELHMERFRKIGRDVIIMCLVQAFATFVCVTLTFLALGFRPIIALIIGSIGIATAPAATFAIMNKLDISGKMRNVLGGMVVLDDVIEVIMFSMLAQAALLLGNGRAVSFLGVGLPVAKEMGLALLLGLVAFAVLRVAVERRWLMPKGEGRRRFSAMPGPEFISRLISEMPGPSVNIFLICGSVVCLCVGLALHWNLPFLITAAAAGFFVSNFYSREVFKSLSIEGATSVYTLVFFALIGANADIEAFHPENFGFIAAYVVARGVGKIGGTWLGCRLTRQEKRLAYVLPRLMLPQAGVAAVEAFFIAKVLGAEGEVVLSIILPGLIFFEIVGVLASERALLKWRSWMTGGGELLGAEESIRRQLRREKLRVDQILQPDCLRVPFNVSSKGEAIWELICTLMSTGQVTDPGGVLGIILERERQGGITLGEGIAILHGRIPDMDRPAVAMGILPKGREVAFGSAEEDLVDIIYLVLSPPDPPEIHLGVLAAIARMLSNPDVRTRLRYAENEDAAMAIIREHSEQE